MSFILTQMDHSVENGFWGDADFSLYARQIFILKILVVYKHIQARTSVVSQTL